MLLPRPRARGRQAVPSRRDIDGWPLCGCCGQRLVAGPITKAEFLGKWEAEELTRAHGRYAERKPLPVIAPLGWDQDLWSLYRAGAMALREQA